ncbi:MAG: flagellar assembly protein FliW [Bryobacterales bacterium]|nr:flagellar assembly protein FliW [Bryobacterales bacterium]
MPAVQTEHFGWMEYEEDSVVEFPSGLPGFEQERRFVAIEQHDAKPLVFLQSLATPALCFLTLPVLAVYPKYELAITGEDLQELELPAGRPPHIGRDVLCLAILSLNENRPPTANLLAPVVVNLKTRRALQAVRPDSAYSHQHPLPEPPACS